MAYLINRVYESSQKAFTSPVLNPQEREVDDGTSPKPSSSSLKNKQFFAFQLDPLPKKVGSEPSTNIKPVICGSRSPWQDQEETRNLSPEGLKKPQVLGVKVEGFGTSGQETADKIAIVLKGYNEKNPNQILGLTYENSKFTVENSGHLSKDDLQELITQQQYSGWHPEIIEKNKDGNWQIGLSPFAPPLEGLKGEQLEFSNDHATSKEVPQGGATIAKESEKISHLQTYGMGPCVGCTLYDKKSKTGALAHIDTSDKAKGLQSVIDKFKKLGIDPSSLQASIHGGNNTEDSNDIFEAIQNVLKTNRIEVTHASQGNGSNPSTMQLDLSTGEVTTYSEEIPYMNDIKNQDRLIQQSIASLSSSKLNIDDQVSIGTK